MRFTLILLSLAVALSTAGVYESTWAAARGGGKLAQAKAPAKKPVSKATTAKDGNKSESVPEKPEVSLTSSELAASAGSFNGGPSEAGWDEYLKALRAALSQPAAAHADPQAFIKLNPSLTEFGVKVIAAGPGRIWSFPKIEQSQAVLVQWTESKPQVVAVGKRRKKVVAVPVPRLEPLLPPQGVVLKDARILDLPVASEKSGKTERGRFLVCAGGKRGSNSMWLASYRLAGGGWHENTEPLSAIPPFLVSNLAGVLGFSGSDLVVTITPSPSKENHPPAAKEGSVTKLPEPTSSNYKLVLRLVAGKYALEGSALEDTPSNAFYQFVHELEQGHTDLAKAWLIDPSLISIGKYIGLSTRTPETPPRIINMSSSQPGCYRYRLVTFDRYDLISDVTKVKQQWAIKGLFVAGADPLLQKIARSLQPPELKPASVPADSGKAGESKQKEDAKPANHKQKN